jgi:hypothetical protein
MLLTCWRFNNERIRELQKQSSIEQWDYDNGCYRYVLNPEKFAELIVRECMLQCIKVENDVELSDYEGGFKDGALFCYVIGFVTGFVWGRAKELGLEE